MGKVRKLEDSASQSSNSDLSERRFSSDEVSDIICLGPQAGGGAAANQGLSGCKSGRLASNDSWIRPSPGNPPAIEVRWPTFGSQACCV